MNFMVDTITHIYIYVKKIFISHTAIIFKVTKIHSGCHLIIHGFHYVLFLYEIYLTITLTSYIPQDSLTP